MRQSKPGATSRLVRAQTIRGEPVEVRGRTLVPVARVVSLGRARASIGTHRLEGHSWGATYVKPLAVLERTPRGERRIAVRDGTARALLAMYLAAVGITLFFAAIRWLAREQGPAGRA